MRSQPFIIRAIAGKTAPQLVINTTLDHFIEAQQSLFQGRFIFGEMIVPQQVLYRKSLWELRRFPKATPFRICIGQQVGGNVL